MSQEKLRKTKFSAVSGTPSQQGSEDKSPLPENQRLTKASSDATPRDAISTLSLFFAFLGYIPWCSGLTHSSALGAHS